ncbi:hypothetical protein IWZ00DRAFT_548613 [Phyllosticta capitalensis]
MAEDGEANQLERRVEGVLVREDHPRIIIISDHDKETAIPFAAFGKSLIMADDDDNDDADIFMGGSILASIFGSNNETETGHVDKVTSTTRTPRPVHAEEFEPAVEAAKNPSSTDNGSGVGDREATETSHDGEWIAQDSNSAIPVGPKSNNEENELRAPETFTPIVYTGANHTGAENHEPAAEAMLGAATSVDHSAHAAADRSSSKQTDDGKNGYPVSAPPWATKTILTAHASAETDEGESYSEGGFSSEEEEPESTQVRQQNISNALPTPDQSQKKEKKTKKSRGWSTEEQNALAESVRHVVENYGRDEGEWRMWEMVHERLGDVHGVEKTPGACRNWYCRKLRVVTGFDERQNPNPDRLVTCAQK